MRWMIVGSMLAHLAVIAVVVAVSSFSKGAAKERTVITTRLVRLGKERPKEFLPRKAVPPPPTKASKVPVTESKPAAKKPEPKPQKDAVTAKERVEHLSQLSSALDRLKKTEEPEGRADGSQFGDSLTDSLVVSKYTNEIGLCLKQHYFIEGVGAAKVAGKQATVALWIDADGKFLAHKIEVSSGSSIFDRATERAVQGCAKVSPPPPEIRKSVREDGVAIEFRPD